VIVIAINYESKASICDFLLVCLCNYVPIAYLLSCPRHNDLLVEYLHFPPFYLPRVIWNHCKGVSLWPRVGNLVSEIWCLWATQWWNPCNPKVILNTFDSINTSVCQTGRQTDKQTDGHTTHNYVAHMHSRCATKTLNQLSAAIRNISRGLRLFAAVGRLWAMWPKRACKMPETLEFQSDRRSTVTCKSQRSSLKLSRNLHCRQGASKSQVSSLKIATQKWYHFWLLIYYKRPDWVAWLLALTEK